MYEVRTNKRRILLVLLGAAFLLAMIHESRKIRASDGTGQTVTDVSKGDIKITQSGTAGGGLEAINQAKTKDKIGEFQLTFRINDVTEVEIIR